MVLSICQNKCMILKKKSNWSDWRNFTVVKYHSHILILTYQNDTEYMWITIDSLKTSTSVFWKLNTFSKYHHTGFGSNISNSSFWHCLYLVVGLLRFQKGEMHDQQTISSIDIWSIVICYKLRSLKHFFFRKPP